MYFIWAFLLGFLSVLEKVECGSDEKRGAKTIITVANELSASYADLSQAIKRAARETKTAKQLWRRERVQTRARELINAVESLRAKATEELAHHRAGLSEESSAEKALRQGRGFLAPLRRLGKQ